MSKRNSHSSQRGLLRTGGPSRVRLSCLGLPGFPCPGRRGRIAWTLGSRHALCYEVGGFYDKACQIEDAIERYCLIKVLKQA